ncbi:putative APSES transcription factor Xbp1 [Taphrina deformans PYCC 5710]|uniref:APSES transcription factor Xbp1 n=1 Tax=Taphrina deformans (strain PYCC 5710 / ATCC 11124 / CBS 356.35 / IMI 108563 / JCM 9778 / NBRC 8474) TaxID=1097556 RepID=R4X867_TAPDE|nr:putative APSES transcription factor Xbp1 [Taphrina deformans PYCC 5710]|eukprot:CCG81724.1 putative APSES transcription factor Xbp1 [Taphrina deformans PYCC 5710]
MEAHSFIAARQYAQRAQALASANLDPREPSILHKSEHTLQFDHHLDDMRPRPALKKNSSSESIGSRSGVAPKYHNMEHKPASKTTTTTTPSKAVRTIPRSRHYRSSSPEDDEARIEDKHTPYTTTAQGFPVNNKVTKAKYATSIDDRGFLTVYEFQLNDQTIMWDYSTGFVHLTGIWKALGNSKADIVRLVENHPELEGVIKRIRGGFLKIQGTWVPYDLCRRLALRTCHPIRHALISVFGPDFPDECLKPGIKGYGTLTLDDSGIDKKRKKRKAMVGADVVEVQGQNGLRTSEREKRPRTAHTTRTQAASLTTPTESSRSSSSSPPPLHSLDAKRGERTSPPSLPRIVNLPNGDRYPSKPELLDLLRASRSLQRLSAGGAEDWTDEGGAFLLAGKSATFVWDGSDALEVLEPEAFTTMDRSSSWQMPPRMARKFSTATQDSAPGDYPITPPQQYPVLNVNIKQVPSFQDLGGPLHMPMYAVPGKMSGVPPAQPFRMSGMDVLRHEHW